MPQDQANSDQLPKAGKGMKNASEQNAEPAQANATAPGEFTTMFRALSGTDPQPTVAERTTEPPASSGFTQVFTQIAKPTSAPPEPARPQAAPSTQPGEFTQFFSSIAAPQQPQAKSPSSSEDVRKQGQPGPPEAAAPPPTQQENPAAPGGFTQLFQQVQSAAQVPPRAASQSPRSNPGYDAPKAFEETARPFSTPPADRSRPSPQGGSFTQLLQSLSSEPSAALANPPIPPLSSGVPASPPPTDMRLNISPANIPPAQPEAGGGEFTRLMQGLQQPPAGQSAFGQLAARPAAPEPAAAPFFSETHQQSGTSEFTRVVRGGAFRQGGLGASAQNAPPAAPASVAPGLAIAPAKTEVKTGNQDGKSKKLPGPVILLIVLNGILILALAVLAYFLLHKH